jgi:hypothetical protein
MSLVPRRTIVTGYNGSTPIFGENHIVGVDRTNNLVLKENQKYSVTTSDITICAATCFGGTFDFQKLYKLTSTSSQNGTNLLVGSEGSCVSTVTPASPVVVSKYTNGPCTAPVTATYTLLWEVAVQAGCAGTNFWSFRIYYGSLISPSTNFWVFWAESSDFCFPQTLTNQITSSDCLKTILMMPTCAVVDNWAVGYGGTATVSLSTSGC